jgi:putative DNA primase/helicase
LRTTNGRWFNTENVKKQSERINLQNGLFDPNTFTLSPHDRNFWSTVQLPFAYEAKEELPVEWLAFLDTIMEKDTERIALLQEMFGYYLTKSTAKHKFFLFYGPTARNGKSTVASVLGKLAGSRNVSYLSLEEINHPGSHIVEILNKSVNITEEMSTHFHQSDRFANLVSGGSIMFNPKYKTPFSATPHIKFIFCTNDLPRFQDMQNILARAIIIPFEYHIPLNERIEEYASILFEKESGAIFKWSMEGLRRLLARGERGSFRVSKKSNDVLNEYRSDNNSVISFLEEDYTFGSYDIPFTARDLYGTKYDYAEKVPATGYISYCDRSGLSTLGFQKFAKELSRYGKMSEKIQHGIKDGKTVYRGLQRIKTGRVLQESDFIPTNF